MLIVDDTQPEDSSEFITTFETVTDENNKTVIKPKNKKVTKKDNFVVEEVLSDEDATPIKEDDNDVQIEEVFDDEGKLHLNLLFFVYQLEKLHFLFEYQRLMTEIHLRIEILFR